jgi:hypothetical protein
MAGRMGRHKVQVSFYASNKQYCSLNVRSTGRYAGCKTTHTAFRVVSLLRGFDGVFDAVFDGA